MAELYEYAVLLLWGWFGIVLVLNGLASLTTRVTELQIPQRLFLWVAALAIIVAGFRAWHWERGAHEDTRNRLATAQQEVARLQGAEHARRAREAEGRSDAARPPVRWISDGQRALLLPGLQRLGETRTVAVRWTVDSVERQRYAQDIASLFHEAGWPIDQEQSGGAQILSPSSPSGLLLLASSDDPIAQPLLRTLREAAIAVDLYTQDEQGRPIGLHVTAPAR